MTGGRIIAIDIGGTQLRLALFENNAILAREAVPTGLLNDPAIWDALLVDMPMTAMLRNLGKMSAVGLLMPAADAQTGGTKPAKLVKPAARPQQKSQEELKALREKKLAKPVFENAAWILD